MLYDFKTSTAQLLRVVAHRAEDDLRARSMNRAAPEHCERLNHHNPLGPVERGVGGH